jgi:hypothetical protein
VVSASFDDVGAVSPTVTLEVELSGPTDPQSIDATTVALVEGVPDESLLGRIERGDPMLSLPALTRSVSARGTLKVTPERVLRPSTRYTLLLAPPVRSGASVLGRWVPLAFTTGSLDDADPIVELIAPEADAREVVRNLREVRLRYSRPVEYPERIVLARLDEQGGQVVAAKPGRPWCEGGSCVALLLHEVLAARARYEVIVDPSVVDDRGRPVFGRGPGFTTGTDLRDTALVLSDVEVTASDGCVVARFRTDGAALGELCVGSDCVQGGPRLAHELALELGANAQQSFGVELYAIDESTRPPANVGPIGIAPPAPATFEISEVLLHAGASVAPFVELASLIPDPIALVGYVLHVGAETVVLGDLAIAPRARLAVGELPHMISKDAAVWVTDADDRTVSRFETEGLVLAPGQSAVRAQRCAVHAAFGPSPTGGATPGTE